MGKYCSSGTAVYDYYFTKQVHAESTEKYLPVQVRVRVLGEARSTEYRVRHLWL